MPVLLRKGGERMGTLKFQTLLADQSAGAEARWKIEVDKLFYLPFVGLNAQF